MQIHVQYNKAFLVVVGFELKENMQYTMIQIRHEHKEGTVGECCECCAPSLLLVSFFGKIMGKKL